MKAFPWLLTTALMVLCIAFWVISEFTIRAMIYLAMEPPRLTKLIVVPHWWLFGAPIPWLVYSAVLSFRQNLLPSHLFVFTGVWTVFVLLLISLMLVAVTLPFWPRHS